MNQNPISQDDPRLTLYALHEMEPAERDGFEKLLQQDAAARQTVEEIRALAATVTTALEGEPAFAEALADKPVVQKTGKVLRFPQIYFMISGLAAACFAVFFTYWQQHRSVYAPHNYMAVDLAKAGAADAQKKESDSPVAAAMPVAPASAVTLTLAESAKADEVAERRMDATAGGAARSVAAQPAPDKSKVFVLSQLSIRAKSNESYTAATTVAGNRMQSELKDEGNTVTVETRQFLRDIAATNAGDTLTYSTKTESDDAKGNLSNVSQHLAPSTVKSEAFAIGGHQKISREPESNTEAYSFQKDNDYLRVADQPLSTFSVDVDTASYANVRRFLTQGQRPPADAVRIEELVNYFPYRYAPPTGNVPFAAHLEVASAPWAPEHRLVRIGLKGREVSDAQRPAANLVFLLDVSGSMDEPNKLPLVKQSLRLLVNKLRSDDHVAIAVYAGASGLALPSTPANRKAEILDAIDRLQAEGSTNGAMGIQLAYDIAKANFVPGGVNRVILATDGDFNVGVTSEGGLMRLIEEKAKSGVFLTVLGFGMGNIKDRTLEQLADKGNGNYAYIDTLAEAKKTLVEQAGGTLVTIAKDVKIQVEFNPAQVQAYRLIGYENRLLAKEDFNNDKVDAGEIGAGHTVTALYEVVPVGADAPVTAPGVDALKYQKTEDRGQKTGNSGEMLTVKIRYKEPAGDVSNKLEFPLRDTGVRFEDASADFKFAAAVAGFGMALRESPHMGSLTLAAVADWGRAGLGDDAGGYRNEFLGLVKQAEAQQQ